MSRVTGLEIFVFHLRLGSGGAKRKKTKVLIVDLSLHAHSNREQTVHLLRVTYGSSSRVTQTFYHFVVTASNDLDFKDKIQRPYLVQSYVK